MSAPVRMDVRDGIAVITLDRHEVRNAIDQPTAEAIAAALDELDDRPDIRVGVLTGTGAVFSAGMDLRAFSATGERPVSRTRGGFGIVEAPPAKPLIAAVEGKALGGGFEMVLACDLVVAADDAWFGLPEVRRGLVAAAGGALRLPRRIPRSVAMELVLTGEPVNAARALELGLVNRVVRPGAAVDEARTLAAVIAANAPLAVRTAKLLVGRSADWPAEEAFARQAPYTDAVRSSNDAAEGARAFVEKRAPEWTGT
ncbi:crotonase/enoyl-CoA hydratase family protein [Streptomyces sp. NPDC058001]|uniref:crotonase/enoyl-CoA hydratase family protein n=1 Tax=Streptomyces sp. NPDC058001 TaxID=3346300 RepID=UPI0036E8C314